MNSITNIVKKLRESRTSESASLEDNVINMYLNGDSVSEIAYNLDITRADVKVILDDYKESRKDESEEFVVIDKTTKEKDEYRVKRQEDAEKKVKELIDAGSDEDKITIMPVKESEGASRSFKVGDIVEYSMLYGGSVTAKVVSRDKDSLELKETWTSEDDGSDVSDTTSYDIKVDKEGSEYIVVWEYRGEEGKVYPPVDSVDESEVISPMFGYEIYPQENGEYHVLNGEGDTVYVASSTMDAKKWCKSHKTSNKWNAMSKWDWTREDENTSFNNAGYEWEILDTNGEYTLVFARGKRITPYVVAWKLDMSDGSWAQGHYFDNEKKAREFLASK